MILTTQEILNTPRCEPWTDERTIEFMNSGIYTNISEKTIPEFIQSVGTLDITYDEIIWIIINNLDQNTLFFSITDLLFLYADILSLEDYKTKLNGFIFSSGDSNKHLDIFTNHYNYLLNLTKDITDEIKLYKLAILFLTERSCKSYDDANYVNILKKVLDIGKQTFSRNMIEEYYITYLLNLDN